MAVKLFEGDHLVVALEDNGLISVDAEDIGEYPGAEAMITKLGALGYECAQAIAALERYGKPLTDDSTWRG